jgi:hypothetical protein
MKKFFTVLLFFFPLIFSCKEPGTVGIEVQPDEDLIGISFTDTSTIWTYTEREDSLRSSTGIANLLLGTMYDPDFGITLAGIYTQFSLNNPNPDFDPSAVLDSAVLTLAYTSSYGDTTQQQNVKVFELTESMNKDSVYFSNRKFSFDSINPLADFSFFPMPNDSVLIDSINTTPHLRIPLDTADVSDFLKTDNAASFANTEEFQKFFKGVFVRTDLGSLTSGQGCIMGFNFSSTFSGITLYYHTDTLDSLKYFIGMDQSAARMNYFDHDYNVGAINVSLTNDTNAVDDIVYIQSMAGIKTKIIFPYLKNFFDQGAVAINKAELILPIIDGSDVKYDPNIRLGLAGIDSAGTAVLILDAFEAGSYYGGTYDETKKQYHFNIARYMQNIVSNNAQDYGLYLLATGASVTANRAMINNITSSAFSRMKLKVTYSKF